MDPGAAVDRDEVKALVSGGEPRAPGRCRRAAPARVIGAETRLSCRAQVGCLPHQSPESASQALERSRLFIELVTNREVGRVVRVGLPREESHLRLLSLADRHEAADRRQVLRRRAARAGVHSHSAKRSPRPPVANRGRVKSGRSC